MSHDIFVSYSSKDKAVADAVVSALENGGLRCWVAPRDVKPSADWGDSISEAISSCKMVLLIFSGHSNRSKHVRDEIYYAISEEKVILPFRIE
ncbi:MAG TPA: toll/interleukin-1 receptor domain-containing protein, partial [Anaerolineales bacterium]|nr:toll/interleukin-1 receptor domain-containing protein [Anaerolineales bacterium]